MVPWLPVVEASGVVEIVIGALGVVVGAIVEVFGNVTFPGVSVVA